MIRNINNSLLIKDRYDENRLLHIILDVGEALMGYGAEVSRVEDTMSRIAKAYGAVEVDVMAITASIMLTVRFKGGHECTQTRRMKSVAGNDFTKFDAINTLSRAVCRNPVPLNHLDQRVTAIIKAKNNWVADLAGYLLVGAGFGVFFGGNLWDVILSTIGGLIIFTCQIYLAPFCMNTIVFNLIASLITGFCIYPTAVFLPAANPDVVLISDIMLLIPGLAMTNAVRDIILGDTIAGLMRLIETFLWATALAIGFLAIMVLL